MPTHTLTVPLWVPHRINEWEGWHWSRKHRLKKEDRCLIDVYARQQGVPAATGKRRVSLVITLEKGQRAPDPDSLWKSTLDACVCAGLLVNDNRQWCVLGNVEFSRGECKETRIILEDVNE